MRTAEPIILNIVLSICGIKHEVFLLRRSEINEILITDWHDVHIRHWMKHSKANRLLRKRFLLTALNRWHRWQWWNLDKVNSNHPALSIEYTIIDIYEVLIIINWGFIFFAGLNKLKFNNRLTWCRWLWTQGTGWNSTKANRLLRKRFLLTALNRW